MMKASKEYRSLPWIGKETTIHGAIAGQGHKNWNSNWEVPHHLLCKCLWKVQTERGKWSEPDYLMLQRVNKRPVYYSSRAETLYVQKLYFWGNEKQSNCTQQDSLVNTFNWILLNMCKTQDNQWKKRQKCICKSFAQTLPNTN